MQGAWSRGSRRTPRLPLFSLLLCGGGNADLEQLGGVAPHDRCLVVVAEPLGAGDEADRIRLGHVERIITAEQDVIAAPDLGEIFELMVGEDDAVEIELLQIARRVALDRAAGIAARAVTVVAASRISRQEPAAMGDANLEPRMGVEHAAEDEVAYRHGRIEGIAD